MKHDKKITVRELIELLKQFPEDMKVNMDYDGYQYAYVYAAAILPVTYGSEQKEELFLLNYWESLSQYKNGRKVYFPKGNELNEEDLQEF